MRLPRFHRPFEFKISRLIRSPGFYLRYLYSLGIILLITAGGIFIRDLIVPVNLVMPYLLGVISIAVLWGRGPAVFASVLGVIAFDVFLVPPYLTLAVADTEYIITFLALFMVGVFISSLTAQINDQMLAAKDREMRVSLLYQLSRDLASAYSLSDVLNAIVDNIRSTLGSEVTIYILDPEGPSHDMPRFEIFPSERSHGNGALEVVTHTFRTGKPSGFGRQAFPESPSVYLPLSTNRGTLGVIGISDTDGIRDDPLEHYQIYEAFANLSALAIERVFLNKQAGQAQLLKAKDDLQSTLLNSVSHDFRTPLVTIIGTLSSLDSETHRPDSQTQQNLVRHALKEAEKLNRLVSNLLNMSRLESGAVQLQLEPVDLQDLIGATLEDIKNRMDGEIRITIPDGLPLVRADFVLIQQALINLLDNAMNYSPAGAPIEIEVRLKNGWIYIAVSDRGSGIDEKELPNIFNKFYRIRSNANPGGTGLGLAIVKGIMDAHSAKVEVSRRKGGGMVFSLGFPEIEIAMEAARAG